MNKEKYVLCNSLSDWKLIGRGSFGSVYKVKHNDLKLTVAVKNLRDNVSQGLEDLFSEAEKMDSASSNPYVIRLYGILKDGPPGIVMEYMEYGSLGTLMERVEPMPWALKYRILYEVALGMNYLHTLSPPLLHLDLKTKNILIDGDVHIKITDFGLSKYTSGSSICKLDQCDGVAGTIEYMPPEAFKEGYQPHKSTDVYSFAILSAVVLKGEDPYPVTKSILIRECVTKGQRPCLKSLQKENSVKYLNETVQLTMKCWDNDMFQRPSFSECCNQWETFYSSYDKSEIKNAVREVQDTIDSYDKKAESSHNKCAPSITSTDMVAMVEKLKTVKISESSFVPNQAVPVKIPQETQRQYTGVPEQHLPQAKPPGAWGPTHQPMTQRPQYPGAYYPYYWPPYYPRYQTSPYGPAFVHSSYPQSALPATTVNISDCAGPIQIGHNNSMIVRTYESPRANTRLTGPGQTTPRYYSPPLTRGPMQTTQPQPTMPSREAFMSHNLCKQESEPKLDQPIQIPLPHATAISGSQQGQVNHLSNIQGNQPNSQVFPKQTGH